MVQSASLRPCAAVTRNGVQGKAGGQEGTREPHKASQAYKVSSNDSASMHCFSRARCSVSQSAVSKMTLDPYNCSIPSLCLSILHDFKLRLYVGPGYKIASHVQSDMSYNNL